MVKKARQAPTLPPANAIVSAQTALFPPKKPIAQPDTAAELSKAEAQQSDEKEEKKDEKSDQTNIGSSSSGKGTFAIKADDKQDESKDDSKEGAEEDQE